MKEIRCIQARDNRELTTELQHSSEPVVLRDFVKHWPAVAAAQSSNLDLAEYLMKLDGGAAITAMIAPAAEGGRLFYNEDFSGFNFQYKRMGLSDAIQQIIDYIAEPAPPTLYVGSTNVDHWLPGFRDDNDVALHDLNPLASIWLGNQSQVAAHFDFPSNLACVVAGRRKVTLFPPEQIENLYIGPLDFTPAGQPISLIDFKQPDLVAHPRFEDALAQAQSAELTAGDALIIPSMWWHHIEALEEFNVLVNYWWRSSPDYLGAPLNALQHAILALRDLPPEQRTAWQQLFNHYVFNNGSKTTDHIPMQARGILNPLEKNSAKDLKAFLRENLQ
ncbi:MAG: cupin-like domain-containing protein [Gammaproteobacteria bacterium]|jgi:hypothetical protein|nr:cupin-like domain-containing protein [Gammaproteobacteria bacterium]MBT5203831.1 cupin-like domain-containing protein [Gammaproteobacteria bacterium]MBT5603149.1 cupin-like domain-containing protein [Gammaproteobacteria bacterium]MBT6245973.1 cupin-like domain-containing protein [Gammaproteobacteria bacterium]